MLFILFEQAVAMEHVTRCPILSCCVWVHSILFAGKTTPIMVVVVVVMVMVVVMMVEVS